MDTSAGPGGASRAAMPFILVAVLIDMVSIGIIVPVLPQLVGTLSGSASEQAFWVGVVSFAFAIASFIGAPVLGALSDRYGRRPVLLLGFCGLGLNFFATALATELWMLIAVRLLGGAMQANAAVANAYVADITAPEDRARRFGMLGAMFGLGFILGPATGGALGAIDIHLPFFVAGVLSMLNLAYGWFVLPESLPADRRRPFSWAAVNPLTSVRALIGLEGVGKLVLVLACTSLAQGVLYNSWVLYTTFKFGWGSQENGASLAAVGVMSVLVQGFLLGRLLKWLPAHRLAVVGLVSSTLAYLLWGLAWEGWMMVAVVFANLLGFTVTASLQSVVSSAADATRQGQTLGTTSALNSLMAVLAPVLVAPLLMTAADLPQGHPGQGVPLYFGALLQGIGLAVAWWHFRHDARFRAAPVAAADATH